jgi:hypothetical protein
LEYQIIGLGNVYLTWQPDPVDYSAELQHLADQTWANRPHHVFNGATLVHHQTRQHSDGVELVGRYTDYQFYYSQKVTGQSFGIAPIAVSGLMLAEGHLIFGKRSPQVTSYPDWWELAPSGAIDKSVALPDGRVDVIAQLTQEFVEEIRLPAQTIQSIRPMAAIFDPADPVYDIICQIHLTATPSQVLAAMHTAEEYSDAAAVPLADLRRWLAEHQHDLIPPSHATVQSWLDHAG